MTVQRLYRAEYRTRHAPSDDSIRKWIRMFENTGATVKIQNKARPHTANITRQFFERHDIRLLRHPAMSPDLNPIEHVRDILGRRLRQNYPNLPNLAALENALIRVWRQIPQQMIRNCISNMRQRLQAVIQSRGGNTRYCTHETHTHTLKNEFGVVKYCGADEPQGLIFPKESLTHVCTKEA